MSTFDFGFTHIYVALLCLRATFVVSPGYVHPDEFFQSGEVMAAHVLGQGGGFAPEFASSEPFRSYVPIVSTSGLSFRLLQWCNFGTGGQARLIAPRVIMLLLSIVSDKITYAVANKWHGQVAARAAVFIRASSWISIVLSVRSFSNTLELFFLDALFAASLLSRWRICAKWALIGIIVAAGCFVRITFPAFAASVVVFTALSHRDRMPYALLSHFASPEHSSRLQYQCLTPGGTLLSLTLERKDCGFLPQCVTLCTIAIQTI